MQHKCNKCNKTFKSDYTYNLHKNKKIVCDTIFECVKCKKEFKNNYSLTAHKNKKIPCVSDNIELQIRLEEIKLSIKKEEVKLELEHRKLDIKEKELESKKDIIELKKLAFIEKNTCIEKLKTERKEKTVSQINNIHIENKIQNNIKIEQNFIQNINLVYGDKPQIISIEDAAKNLADFLVENDNIATDMFREITDHEQLLKDCLTKMYENDSNKPIAYNNQLQIYYSLLCNKVGKLNVVKSEFEDIKSDLVKHLSYLVNTVSSIHSSLGNCSEDLNLKSKYYEKFKEINQIRDNMKDVDMQPIASDVFSHCET